MTAHAADTLLEAIDRVGSPACVGLDPVLERLPSAVRTPDPAASIEAFCLHTLDAIAGVVPAVKPQSACFERYGSAGLAALERVVAKARELDLFVILDAKRGDIGLTASHYAAFAYEAIAAHAVTVNPYMGFDTIEPFRHEDKLIFALVRTSNPGSDAIQSVQTSCGTVAETIAKGLASAGESNLGARAYSDLGAVVAATKPEDAARLRELMPRQLFLVPGFGAQGGTVETVRELFSNGTGAIINASRSVLYAEDAPSDWTGALRARAAAFAERVASIR